MSSEKSPNYLKKTYSLTEEEISSLERLRVMLNTNSRSAAIGAAIKVAEKILEEQQHGNDIRTIAANGEQNSLTFIVGRS